MDPANQLMRLINMEHWSSGNQQGKTEVSKHKLALIVNLPITNPMSNTM